MAGLLLQSITRNLLASPTLLGINSGASLTIVVAIARLILPFFLIQLKRYKWHWGTPELSCLLVGLISTQWRNLILSGVAVSILCAALTKMTMMLAEDATFNIMSWLECGYEHIRWASAAILAVFIIPSLVISFLLAKAIKYCWIR